MLVKICGFSSAWEAREAAKAGADYIGLHVGVSDSLRNISAQEAVEIINVLPTKARAVVLTWLKREKQLLELARETGAGALEVVKDTEPSALAALKKKTPGLKLMKTIRVTGGGAVLQARAYAPFVDFLVLDTRVGKQLGGTSKKHDWSVCKRIAQEVSKPVFLAGGLNAQNVAKTIEYVKPAGVDVNTGVNGGKGEKSFKKMCAFVKAAKAVAETF